MLILLILSFFFVTVHNLNTPPTVHELSTNEPLTKKENKAKIAMHLATIGAQLLKKNMRDPDSFYLESAFITDIGAVCYEYRSRNGFGGMNREHAIITIKREFSNTGMPGFADLWNRECADKYGTEAATSIRYAL